MLGQSYLKYVLNDDVGIKYEIEVYTSHAECLELFTSYSLFNSLSFKQSLKDVDFSVF